MIHVYQIPERDLHEELETETQEHLRRRIRWLSRLLHRTQARLPSVHRTEKREMTEGLTERIDHIARTGKVGNDT